MQKARLSRLSPGFNLRREASSLATERCVTLPGALIGFNLRREASSLATMIRAPVSCHIFACFNLRREASSLATRTGDIRYLAWFEFQSQTRSQFPRYMLGKTLVRACSRFQSQTRSQFPRYPFADAYLPALWGCFNLRREASSLATGTNHYDGTAYVKFQSQTRSQFPRYKAIHPNVKLGVWFQSQTRSQFPRYPA